MRKTLLWLWLLTKRLYRRPSQILILLAIPVLVWGYTQATAEDSGIATVVLVGDQGDPTVAALMDSLAADTQLVRFLREADIEEARALVEKGKATEAWIFPQDTAQRLEAFPQTKAPVVQVLGRQEDVAGRLTREVLTARLYCACSEQIYLTYIRQQLPDLADLSDEALLRHYHSANITQELFSFRQEGSAGGYLTAPIRGLLAVVILLCALAAAISGCRDDSLGTFAWLTPGKRTLVAFAGIFLAVLGAGLACYAALWLSGLILPGEWAVLGLYVPVCALDALALRRLLGDQKRLAATLPLLVVLCLTVCPVFFDLPGLHAVQVLLPPTGYLLGVYDPTWVLALAGHGAVSLAILLLTGRKSK